MKGRRFVFPLLILILVLILISIFSIRPFQGNANNEELGKFDKALTSIGFDTKTNTKLSNLYDLKTLLGKDKSYIEKNYSYSEILENDPVNTRYIIDSCIVIHYEDDIVTQISTGIYLTENCIQEDLVFDKATRLELLGTEDKENRFTGLPGFGEYSYIDEGVSIIKSGNQIMQVWITNPTTLKKYIEDRSVYRLNVFGYNPEYDGNGGLLKATEEE